MTEEKLRRLFRAGLTYDEIAEANLRAHGWRPTRSGVAKKLARLEFPPRNASHEDLIPWPNIRPQHSGSRLKKMLEAESRKRKLIAADERDRQGEDLSNEDRMIIDRGLSDTDKWLVSLLYDLLFGRGSQLVVGYDEDVGFYLTDAADEDETIIRRPDPGAVRRSSEGTHARVLPGRAS